MRFAPNKDSMFGSSNSRPWLPVLSPLVVASLLLPASIEASDGSRDGMEPEAISRAAGALARASIDSEEARSSWAWRRGGESAAPNTAGLVALALIEAHASGVSREGLRAAVTWADARVEDVEQWRPVFDPDVEALCRLAEVTGDARYANAAAEAFDRRWQGATGDEIVARLLMVRDRRPELVGFDVALVMRAALAVGNHALAHDVGAAALDARDAWDIRDTLGAFDVEGLATTSRAAFLEAIHALSRDEKHMLQASHERLIEELMVALVDTQQSFGAWAGRNTQTTAHAVRALSAIDHPLARESAERGARWLLSTQLHDGNWASFHDGLPEPFVGDVFFQVTAESLRAIVAAGDW